MGVAPIDVWLEKHLLDSDDASRVFLVELWRLQLAIAIMSGKLLTLHQVEHIECKCNRVTIAHQLDDLASQKPKHSWCEIAEAGLILVFLQFAVEMLPYDALACAVQLGFERASAVEAAVADVFVPCHDVGGHHLADVAALAERACVVDVDVRPGDRLAASISWNESHRM